MYNLVVSYLKFKDRPNAGSQRPLPLEIYMKLKRGQKLCKNCNQINGARAHTCKHCNNEFKPGATSKNKKTKPRKVKKFEEITDWKELKNGDRIKVVARSGNYYLNDETGEKQYLTDGGIYTIQDIDSSGLVVYANGYGYIYMGPEVRSNTIPNMYRSPHKILRANLPVRP